jgi:[ribosomal protein S18]-alanine N-acetyltransferase
MASRTKQIGDLEIGPLTAGDLDELMQIERSSFRAPWSSEMFRQDLEFPIARCLAARVQGAAAKQLAGYIICWFVADEVHVTNIAVREDLRNRRIATRLVEEALSLARNDQMRFCTLEVRRSTMLRGSSTGGSGSRPGVSGRNTTPTTTKTP